MGGGVGMVCINTVKYGHSLQHVTRFKCMIYCHNRVTLSDARVGTGGVGRRGEHRKKLNSFVARLGGGLELIIISTSSINRHINAHT